MYFEEAEIIYGLFTELCGGRCKLNFFLGSLCRSHKISGSTLSNEMYGQPHKIKREKKPETFLAISKLLPFYRHDGRVKTVKNLLQ